MECMKTLYIIGAGSSKNYDQCNSPVPKLEVPLNNDFFKMAKKVIDYYDLSHMYSPITGLDHFIRNINRLLGYSGSQYDTSSFLDDRLSLEEIMVHFYLEYEILNKDTFLSMNPRTRTLNDLLAYALAESLSGEPCRKHRRLAKRMSSNDVIWNFNYDILLDNALRAEAKFIDSGYKMMFDYTYVDGTWKKPDYKESLITMLKLHGSLNWLKCNSCGSKLLLSRSKDVPALWTGLRELNLECPRCNSTKHTGLERYIIPPGIKVFSDKEILYLWKTASKISNIENIISVGYSFSDFDTQVKMLLRVMNEHSSFSSNIPITIVTHSLDSYKAIEKRVKNIFPKSQTEYMEASNFFSS